MTDTYTISASGKASIVKDPNATLDYSLDWTEWLDGDTIVSLLMVKDASLTIVSQSINGTASITTAFVSGGVVGEAPIVTFRITTAAGRTDDRSITLKIKER